MNDILEKVIFAALPVLISAIVYVGSSMTTMQTEIINLRAKISLVVTDSNEQASNTGAELAREKLKEELKLLIDENKDAIAVNTKDIAVLEQRVLQLEDQ
jgi:cell division protein FtsL